MGIRLKCWNIPRKNKAIMLPMFPLNALPIVKIIMISQIYKYLLASYKISLYALLDPLTEYIW